MACTIHNTAASDAALTILAGRGQVSNELMYAHVKYKLNQSQGGMCICRGLGKGLDVSPESFGS